MPTHEFQNGLLHFSTGSEVLLGLVRTPTCRRALDEERAAIVEEGFWSPFLSLSAPIVNTVKTVKTRSNTYFWQF
jgi:hypothetical protein